MAAFRVIETYQDLKRYSQIVSVFVRHGFGELLQRLRAGHYLPWERVLGASREPAEHLSAPERLRLAFEELGPTFIKLGQLLSTRPDVIPPDFIGELAKLQDQAPPFPFAQARAVIEEELKRPIADLFISIEERHQAAASLAQVHLAVTKAGDVVAVKVQRPGIETVIEADIRILHDLAGLAERHLGESRQYEPTRLVDEFARTIRRELDFVREGRNIDRFRRNFAEDRTVYIPRVHWDLCGRRVLSTEYIKGTKVSDLDRIEKAGLDRTAIAGAGADFTLREIFDFHFFHADPHPGNLFVLPGNVIAVVDFGMTGAITDDAADNLSDIFIAVVNKDAGALVRIVEKLGWLPENAEGAALKLDLHELIEQYAGTSPDRVEISSFLEDVTAIVRRFGIRIPSNLMLMVRALLVSEGVGRMLDPEFKILENARPYARRLMLRRYDPIRELRDVYRAGGEAAAFLKRLPSDLEKLIKKLTSDKLAVKFVHVGLEGFTNEVERSTNRLSFAVVIAALIIGSSLVFRSGLGPALLGYPVLGLAGFVIASLMGLWLLVGILRSGRL